MSIIDLDNDFALLDNIRRRYQGYLGDYGVEALSGLLTGYAIATENYNRDEFFDFCEYLKRRQSNSDPWKSWIEHIQKEAWEKKYEIPIFFQYLDEYRKSGKSLYCVTLEHDQKSFTFNERHQKVENPEYPTKGLPAPSKLR